MRKRVHLRPFGFVRDNDIPLHPAQNSGLVDPQSGALAAHVPAKEYSKPEAADRRVVQNRSELPDRDGSRLYCLYRRGRDIMFAILALLLFLLLLPVLALAIKLDSTGPVFYVQDRVGLNRRRQPRSFEGEDQRKVLQPGRPFRIYKLRTMRSDAEEAGPQWATRGDTRITRIGRFLRKSRLDEFPQFWNVLRGEMSLIGPRPERLCFIRKLEKEVPQYRERLLVLPGITGLAQVRNGYDDSTESVKRKVALDREYIHNHSILGDLKIILSTIKVLFTGDGAC